MTKDIELIKRLGEEIGRTIEVREEPSQDSDEYRHFAAQRIEKLEEPRRRSSSHFESSATDPAQRSFNLITLCIQLDGVNPESRLAIIDLDGHVVRLYLNSFGLEVIPPALFKLEDLEILFLYGNKFQSLPPDIRSLSRLLSLAVQENDQLHTLPREVAQLPRLVEVFFNELPSLSTPPQEIARQGIDAVRNYFESLDESKGVDYLYEAKMVLVGRGFAGKTSLVRKLTKPEYRLEEKIKSTEGIAIDTWDLEMPLKNSNHFRFNIWDFGGQEKYDATHQFFITERTVYLFVTEARQESNYLDFDYWLNIIDVLANDSPVIVVQNKID